MWYLTLAIGIEGAIMSGVRIKAVEELGLLMAIPAPSAASLREGFANTESLRLGLPISSKSLTLLVC
jgi:hypothetical protein